jgi:hypothetical protein
MDDDERRYFDGIMQQMNIKLDDILDKLSEVRADLDSTKGSVISAMEHSLSLSRRLAKLEDRLRRDD